MQPRAVFVTRPTVYEGLLARHGTHGQADWVLRQTGQDIAVQVAHHARQADAFQTCVAAVPEAWRQTAVTRAYLDRFLFEPEDVVIAVGPDGLVANVAKYLIEGQPVIGVNPDPDNVTGVLVQHAPAALADLLRTAKIRTETRTMIQAETSAGHTIRALNEVFVGHTTHQSARYTLQALGLQERHSSSGVIVATGTGATGWARSIHQTRKSALSMPRPTASELVFFAREPWPSATTGASVSEGLIRESVVLVSEMTEGGTVFGDGIESDPLPFEWGTRIEIGRAEQGLVLAV